MLFLLSYVSRRHISSVKIPLINAIIYTAIFRKTCIIVFHVFTSYFMTKKDQPFIYFIKYSNYFTVTGHKEGVVLSWELTEMLHSCFRCLSQKYTLSSCFMAPGRRAVPMLSACLRFLGLFCNAGCSIGADCSCLIQQICELEGDGGCLTQRVTCRRG